jgi:hypothetical protein
MASPDERATLLMVIDAVESFREGRFPHSYSGLFGKLISLDQSENLELWKRLRMALIENDDFRADHNFGEIEDPEIAAEGYWWFDRALWHERQSMAQAA